MGVPLGVLIVEDSEDDALLLLRELRRGGYQPRYRRVDTAADMEAALDEGGWDLVISDHSMPRFSSSGALELLRRRDLDLPFILVSGRIGEEAAAAAMKAGAYDYVMKDNLTRLNAAIERELREAGERREKRRAQGALEVSEARFRQMFEQSPLSIQIFSPDGRILRVNRAWERLWSLALDRIPDYNVLRDPRLVEKGIMPYIERGFAGERTTIPPVRYELDETVPDASDIPYRWVQSFIYPVKDVDGTVREVVLVHEDITERRRARAELERQARLLDLTQDAIMVCNLEGRLIFWNRGAEAMYGWSKEKALGATAPVLLKTRYPEPMEQIGARLQRDGFWEGELEQTKRDGAPIVVSSRWALQRDERGEPTSVLEINTDITERKKAEEALRRAEEKYRSIFENAVEGIFQSTVEGKLVTANPSMARIYGYESPEQLLAEVSNVAERLYVDPERREKLGQILRRRGALSGFEVEARRKDESRIWVSIAVRAVRDAGGELTCYEGTVEDITPRKRAEEALEEIKEAERRRIARDLHDGVLQDLTYALQSMQFTRAMSEVGQSDRQEQEIEALQRAVGGVRDAIYDLRLESAEERSFTFSLESLVELNRRMAPQRGIDLVVRGELPPALVRTIGVEVLRIIQEALANVRRHSDAGHASVSVEIEEGEIRAEVKDDGRGFDPEMSAGTGLSGMRERSLVLGAHLEIESRRGSGTRVKLRLALPSLPQGSREMPRRSEKARSWD